MKVLQTPKVGTSDLEVKVVNKVENGIHLTAGTIICELETSKATFEVELDEDGYVYILHNINDLISVGSPLAILSKVEVDPSELNQKKSEILPLAVDNKTQGGVLFSKKASILIDKHRIDKNVFLKEFITEKDVLNYLNGDVQVVHGFENFSFEERDVVIVGLGGHAGMCIDIITQVGSYNLVGFVDDNVQVDEKHKLNFLGTLEKLTDHKKRGLKNVIIGIGFLNKLYLRARLYNELVKSFYIPTIIHPKAIIEPSAVISDGCQIMAGAIIGSNVIIEENCILNSGSIVSHDSIIGRGSHITPGAILAGHVVIGERVTIGMAASVYVGLSISDDSVIPNGKILYENI